MSDTITFKPAKRRQTSYKASVSSMLFNRETARVLRKMYNQPPPLWVQQINQAAKNLASLAPAFRALISRN